jgi:transposase
MRWPDFPPPAPPPPPGPGGCGTLGGFDLVRAVCSSPERPIWEEDPLKQEQTLFAMALGLSHPWQVTDIHFDAGQGQLDIEIDFERGAGFACPECGARGCKAWDSETKSWRHLHFFQHRCDLHARVPRVRCDACGTTRQVEVPWARTGSGFTLLFEMLVLAMARDMPVAAVARLVGEHDTRIWRIVRGWVDRAREVRDDSGVRRVGVDEKSRRRGHRYVTTFTDLDARKTLFVAEGKKADSVRQFREDLLVHGGDPDAITEFCCDMSETYVSGIEEFFPKAAITFDKFHMVKIVSEAVAATRTEEAKEKPELVGMRYAFLKNPENLTDQQIGQLAPLAGVRRSTRKTVRAYHLRLAFQELFRQPRPKAKAYLESWCGWAARSRIPAMIEAARTMRRHLAGILRWFTSRISNGLVEAINGLIQSAIARSRGFRSVENLTTMIYLIAGKLVFQ